MVRRGGGRYERVLRRARPTLIAGSCLTVAVCGALAPADPALARAPFIPGTATATSQALTIAPRTGGLAAAVTIGTSVADYRGSLAQASSQTLDLGLIGTDLTVQCDSTPPLLKPSQLPQPLIAESDHGKARSSQSTAGTTKSGVLAAAGRESVVARTLPSSVASFDGSDLVVPGVLRLTGLHSTSQSRLVPGTSRIASAASSLGQVTLLGGAVVLSDLRWTAVQHTGKSRASHGHFRMGSAVVAGHRLPTAPANLGATIHSVNHALAASGLHLTLPAVTRDHGTLSVSPLAVGIDNSTLGSETVNPGLGAIQPVTDALTNLIIGASCQLGNVLTLGDIALSAVDGTGGLDVELGGATATSNGKSYGSPFGHPGSTSNPNGSPTSTTTGTARNVVSGTPGTGSGSGSTQGRGSTASRRLNGAQTASSSCRTTSPAGRPSCSSGAGLKVALGALGLLAGFAAADAVVLRRRRKAATG